MFRIIAVTPVVCAVLASMSFRAYAQTPSTSKSENASKSAVSFDVAKASVEYAMKGIRKRNNYTGSHHTSILYRKVIHAWILYKDGEGGIELTVGGNEYRDPVKPDELSIVISIDMTPSEYEAEVIKEQQALLGLEQPPDGYLLIKWNSKPHPKRGHLFAAFGDRTNADLGGFRATIPWASPETDPHKTMKCIENVIRQRGVREHKGVKELLTELRPLFDYANSKELSRILDLLEAG